MDKDKLKQELSTDEGNIPHAYPDSRGYLTIGIGRLIDVRKGGRLTPDEVMFLFNNDVARHTADIYKALPWALEMSDGRQRALINMCFQMGIEGLLGFEHMLEAMETGNWQTAHDAALDSAWAKETPQRAARVALMILNG